jgi:hypothetical protein
MATAGLMPRRAAPGDAERIEDVLNRHVLPDLETGERATYLDALLAIRELLNVRDWQEVQPTAQLFQQVACLLRATELHKDGLAAKDALDAAAIELDLSWDTVRSRAKRWPKQSRALCTPPSEGSGGTLRAAIETLLEEVA